MSDFTYLEAGVLSAICDNDAHNGEVIQRLLLAAKVTGRENNGHGFYTQIETARTEPLPNLYTGALNGPDAQIIGMGEVMLMGFILWFENGYPNELEGFQYGNKVGDTVDLRRYDLATLRYMRLETYAGIELAPPIFTEYLLFI
jgi:hypothetical protein